MCKCLECQNYRKNGKRHTCAVCPGTVLFSEGYPNDPIVKDCGRFVKIKTKHQSAYGFRGK